MTVKRSSDGWVQLMRARVVLGETVAPAALAAYPDRPAQQAAFRAAARDLRIPGA